jgi:hypothetical protein
MSNFDSTRIINTLAHLKSAKPDVFGANDHGFRLNPPLSEADTNAFEQLHHITLPEDYRQFLTCIGNGGAGPFYGIFPLGKMDGPFGFHDWQENDGGMIGILSEQFPNEDEWNDLSALPPKDLLERDRSEYYREYEVFDSIYWNSSLVNGAIPICHEGCALRIWLVVTGNQAGFLWEDKRSEYGGLKPLRLIDGSTATFARWYDEWMNACLSTK